MRQIIDISDRIFKTSHMKAPKGYGTWGFIVMDGSCNHEYATFFVPSPTTFSDAKVWYVIKVIQGIALANNNFFEWLKLTVFFKHYDVPSSSKPCSLNI